MEQRQIRFDEVRQVWGRLAMRLDIESVTKYNDWRAVAEELGFDQPHIRAIPFHRHEGCTSCTMTMFKDYIQMYNGGDLHHVYQILKKLDRSDALNDIDQFIAERQQSKLQFHQAYHGHPIPQQVYNENLPYNPDRQHAKSETSPQVCEGPSKAPTATTQQSVYRPTDRQKLSIDKLMFDARPAVRELPVDHDMHYCNNNQSPQDKPMNLKKSTPITPQIHQPCHDFNRRTQNDFHPGFGQEYNIHRGNEVSMDVQYHSENYSLRDSSYSYNQPPMIDRPGDFAEVLIRGQNNLHSLTQTHLLSLPIDRPSPPQLYQQPFNDMEMEHQRVPCSPTEYIPRPQLMYGHEKHSKSHGVMDHGHCCVPLTITPIKQEEEDLTTFTKDYKHEPVMESVEIYHQVPVRESVIQIGPHCNSDAIASPGDLRTYSEPLQHILKETCDEPRVQSFPMYLMRSDSAKTTPISYERKVKTWPDDSYNSKMQNSPSLTPTVMMDTFANEHRKSTDKDFKPAKQNKRCIKVLLTHATCGRNAKRYKKEIVVLYKCLCKNEFVASLDFIDHQEFNKNTNHWLDRKFKEANFILVCITPEYTSVVDPDPLESSLRNTENVYTRSARYMYKSMQNEFAYQNQCLNKRFKPILLPGTDLQHIPTWMQSTVAFRWRENWRDILYMMLEPERILSKMKKNQEKFTKSSPLKITCKSM